MALTSDQITAQNFKDFYGQIRPYLNGSAHGGFTPIGTVIAVMGKSAPLNYLVCDGTVYNIADYPELAAYFTGQFEASNFFGGDGITTFAVPDLRGEFLRGAGTNSHANQGNGANVGVHQDGTEHSNPYQYGTTHGLYLYGNSGTYNARTIKEDSVTKAETHYSSTNCTLSPQTGGSAAFTSRPTNTSVLYCIATKNIFMDAGCNYSTDEQVVGTWVDGKPLYQKVITFRAPAASSWVVAAEMQNVSVKSFGGAGISATSVTYPLPFRGQSAYIIFKYESNNIYYMTSTGSAALGTMNCELIVRYTKTTD